MVCISYSPRGGTGDDRFSKSEIKDGGGPDHLEGHQRSQGDQSPEESSPPPFCRRSPSETSLQRSSPSDRRKTDHFPALHGSPDDRSPAINREGEGFRDWCGLRISDSHPGCACT